MLAYAIQEMQGWYGAFTLNERVIQKIWLRQDFIVEQANTESGQRLEVIHPGRWNLQAGPDFKGARLRMAGREVVGDVEIHFNSSDWRVHGHQSDANFNQVVLHVLLYAVSSQLSQARTEQGHIPESLVLLPLLKHDLESYAMDEALREMEQVDDLEWMLEFLGWPLVQRRKYLQEAAQQRWQQKVDFAHQRLQSQSWEELCHQMCLEVLGYASNRSVMARLALSHPLGQLRLKMIDADRLFAEFSEDWNLNGLRPANHPRLRLRQYLQLLSAQPNWPQRLADFFTALPAAKISEFPRRFRQQYALSKLQEAIRCDIFSSQLASGKLNAVFCDALLPLAAAAGLCSGQAYWTHWYAGNVPDGLRRFVKHAQIVDFHHPHSNGNYQGALAMFLRRSL